MSNKEEISVFDLHSSCTKKLILISGGLIALITPFTDTVYLPALKQVGTYLNAPDGLVSLTISVYLGCVGIGQLLWGPLSDRHGRLLIMYTCLIVYEIFTIGCIFANNITTLIILRCIQGFIVGSTIVSVQAIISDVFDPQERGTAMGFFLAPMLIGPILAPVIGGALSQAKGWRSTFVFLAVMACPIILFAIICIPETSHWKIVQNFNVDNIAPDIENNTDNFTEKNVEETTETANVYISGSSRAQAKQTTKSHLKEFDTIKRPEMLYPWELLIFLFDLELAPYFAAVSASFAAMFTSLTMLPFALALPPYSLSETIIGLTYLPIGIAMLVGAIVGGMLSDLSAQKYNKSPDGRMIYALFGMWLVPLGSIGFGFSLEYGVNISVPLISQSILGFGQAVVMSATMGYLTSARQQNAAAAGSVEMFVCFMSACISVSVSVYISDAIGIHLLFVILAILSTITNIWATYANFYRIFFSNSNVSNAVKVNESKVPENDNNEYIIVSSNNEIELI